MHVDFLIIGQGIAGTFFSYYLEKEGSSFIVIDEYNDSTPSRVAAGIINPVTGRRFVRSWMIDELLPFCTHAYNALGEEFNEHILDCKDIIDFFPTAQMRDAFIQRHNEEKEYMSLPQDEYAHNAYFNYELGYGLIKKSCIVYLQTLLNAWRTHLKKKDKLIEERLEKSQLIVEDEKIFYKEISADRIIFCDGPGTANQNFFKLLPFSYNKGECLLVKIKDLPTHHLYKKNIHLVPTSEKDIFWVGSNYTWKYHNLYPTAAFRESTETHLKQWLKLPVNVIEHWAAERPAVVERRPFIGFHPVHANVGILNGLGTKGCSLAPYFAHQFVQHIVHNSPLSPEVDVRRFTRILSRD